MTLRYTQGYTGQREDATIGLYFYGARYYDPVLGRFTQADTIVPQPGDPGSLNRYSYVLNNPLRYIDPTGHAECEDTDCRETLPARPRKPARPRSPSGVPANAVPTTTPIITTYYTPQYSPQPDAQGNLVADPNLWADTGKGSPYANAVLQGSIVVNGKIWKYILGTNRFDERGPSRGNGVAVNYGWVIPPQSAGTTSDGKYILQVTAAVASPCPHNIRCDISNRAYDPSYQPAFRRGNKPEYVIYVITEGNILIVAPLDTGYGLAANQIDIYMGIGATQPEWTWGSNNHPQAYFAPY